ncbi:MAG: superoxide dismutase family protein [Actinomycetota bacterium]|nr:superoxide dismutase family protein [Actinomycetota bacterium]
MVLWLVLLGALLLLAILLFGILRACGALNSQNESAGSQGEDMTEEEQQASSQAAGGEGGATGVQGTPGATAELQDARGNAVGSAEFVEGPNGVVTTVNLRPGQQAVEPGEHGIHIHEKGDITPDFEAAGEHFNPTSVQHGFDNPEGAHVGDLENIFVNDDGSASYATTSLLTLSGRENAILDSDGSALVIHARADDYRTDPDGESGDRVAAGVIRASATGESTLPSGETTGGPLPGSGGLTVGSVLLPAAALLVGLGVLGYAVGRRQR